MSSIPEDALSELEIVLQGIFTGNYCSIAAIALLVYEWLITIRKEVELFWREPVSGATILFLFNRYLPLLLVLSDFFVILTRSNPVRPFTGLLHEVKLMNATSSCKVLGWAFVWLGLLQYVPWALFSTMRAYAMSGRRWSVAALVLLLSSVTIVLNFVQSITWTHVGYDPETALPELGCGVISTVSLRLAKMYYVCLLPESSLCSLFIFWTVTIVSRSSLILADAVVVVTTWMTTYRTVRLVETRPSVPTFSRVLLVNGTLYFLVLLLLNVLYFATTLLSIGTTELSNTSFVVIFIEPFTAILVSRFLTDLQAVKTRTQHRASETGWSTSGSSSFLDRAALGAVGYALEPGDFQVVSHSASTVETLDPSETEEAGSMDRTLRDSEDQTTSVF